MPVDDQRAMWATLRVICRACVRLLVIPRAAGPVWTAVWLVVGAAVFLGTDPWLSRDTDMEMTSARLGPFHEAAFSR